MNTTTTSRRSTLWRSRWAAIGAAVAVSLGAGGFFVASAASSAPSSFVSIEPARVLDTRTDVGLTGPFLSGVAQKLKVTGVVPTQPAGGLPSVDQQVVPAGATAVVLNVTVIRPGSGGFLSIRPGDALGTPATSNINFGAGGPNIANSVTVSLPTSGTSAGLLDIFVSGTTGEVLVDVAGFYQVAGGTPALLAATAAKTNGITTTPISISSSSPKADLGTGVEIVSLTLPNSEPGTWLFFVKFNAQATAAVSSPATLSCTIETFVAGFPVDRSIVDVFTGEVDNVVLGGTFTAPDGFPTVKVPLVCDPGTDSFDITNVVMTAMPVSVP